MNPPFSKTKTARAAALVCLFWHQPKALNQMVYEANTFFIATGVEYL